MYLLTYQQWYQVLAENRDLKQYFYTSKARLVAFDIITSTDLSKIKKIRYRKPDACTEAQQRIDY